MYVMMLQQLLPFVSCDGTVVKNNEDDDAMIYYLLKFVMVVPLLLFSFFLGEFFSENVAWFNAHMVLIQHVCSSRVLQSRRPAGFRREDRRCRSDVTDFDTSI